MFSHAASSSPSPDDEESRESLDCEASTLTRLLLSSAANLLLLIIILAAGMTSSNGAQTARAIQGAARGQRQTGHATPDHEGLTKILRHELRQIPPNYLRHDIVDVLGLDARKAETAEYVIAEDP